ncbi:MAG: hypothetical protein LBE56_00600 [Tannerella sp.]|jgi:hypothetical protein|nr:hypothetical protein [Tannerella sp.]
MNIKKLKLLLPATVLSLSFLAGSCSDDNAPGIETNKDGTISVIEGKIFNELDESVEIKTVGGCLWDDWDNIYVVSMAPFENGGFRMELPPEVTDESYLELLYPVFAEIPEIKFSDTKVKYRELEIFANRGSEIEMGAYDVYLQTVDPALSKVPDKGAYCIFTYVDRDVTITGKVTSESELDPLAVSEIDLSLKKGWNAVYSEFDYTSKPARTKSSTKAPSGLKWWVDID